MWQLPQGDINPISGRADAMRPAFSLSAQRAGCWASASTQGCGAGAWVPQTPGLACACPPSGAASTPVPVWSWCPASPVHPLPPSPSAPARSRGSRHPPSAGASRAARNPACAPQTSGLAFTFTEVRGWHDGPRQCLHSCKNTATRVCKNRCHPPGHVLQAEPTTRPARASSRCGGYVLVHPQAEPRSPPPTPG